MSAIDPKELVSGLVIHLDTGLLRKKGGSRTNAEKKNDSDRAVEGPHYFLLLDQIDDDFLAVPLFSSFAPGSEILREVLKSGMPEKWVGSRSYFSRWQHWRIPADALVMASGNEESDVSTRRTYAATSHETLATIAGWATKNRAQWRPV